MDIAKKSIFDEAWRTEVPWLQVATRSGNFVKCGLCEYLKAQINATNRGNTALLSALRDRLGSHWDFQSAQRMKQSLLEEKCIQSNGRKWLMDIDKMDQQAVFLPAIWSQLNTPLFKSGDRMMVSVNGSLDPPKGRKTPEEQ